VLFHQFKSRSGVSDALQTSIRNFASVDGIGANSIQSLDKLAKQLERMESQTAGIERGLQNVC
jgi:hypothetical protein